MKIFYTACWMESDGTEEMDGGYVAEDTDHYDALRKAFNRALKLLPGSDVEKARICLSTEKYE